jgi:hypothetical protein
MAETCKLKLLRKEPPAPSEDEIRSMMDVYRHGHQCQFAFALVMARFMWRRFPDLVTAQFFDLPHEFIESYRHEVGADPRDETRFSGHNIFDSDYEEQLRAEVLDALTRTAESAA